MARDALSQIEAFAPGAYEGLARHGIRSTRELLAEAYLPAARSALARRVGIDTDVLEGCLRILDLARIDGIGTCHARLLVEAGVDDVRDLARRRPSKLALSLERANRRARICGHTPRHATVSRWITAARDLPPALETAPR